MVEDFAVAVPAAVGGGAAAGRVVPADVAEDLMVLAAVAQVQQLQQLQVRVALAVARGEAEAANSVHLHEGQVELLGGGSESVTNVVPVSPPTDDTRASSVCSAV